MKNIFKLCSVFLAIALLVGTLLMSGALVSAEPDWQLIYSGSFDEEITFPGSGLTPVPCEGWNTAIAAELAANGVSSKYKIESDASFAGGDGGYACWGIYNADEVQWWGAAFNACEYPYEINMATVEDAIGEVDDTFTFGLAGEGTCTVTATEFKVYAYREATSTTATAAETTATEAEPTATEAEPTATEAEPTATAAETEPTAAEPVYLVETVLVENNVGGSKRVNSGKTDAWFLVVNEIKFDIAKNGPIDPSKGEYYEITVTGRVNTGEADFHLGEGLDWNEYWGESGCITDVESTVTAKIPVAIPESGIGDLYLADSGEDGHALFWSYAKISVFRAGEPVETTEKTESTKTGAAVNLYGDANGDNLVNMKDVLAVRKYVAGLDTSIDAAAADVNLDGLVNMKDVLLIRKFVAGMVTSFVRFPGAIQD